MHDAIDLPQDVQSCHELIRAQAKQIAEHAVKVAQLQDELEKMRRVLHELMHGRRSEKRVPSNPDQQWLPFENDAEYLAARAEAEAEAEVVIQTFTVERQVRKRKPRNESFPDHLRREETVAATPDSVLHCVTHGDRTLVGYDETHTLVYKPADLYVLVTKYPKYACTGHPDCGINSPERPTSLVEGNRYDTSVAATIVEAKWYYYLPIYRHQDLFAGAGWMPSRSTSLNIVEQVEFVADPLVAFMKRGVQQDMGVGLDDTSCRLLIPKVLPVVAAGDLKTQRLLDKIAEARAKGEDSLMAKMWVYSGLHHAPYNTFDFRVSRHRDGPDEFLRDSHRLVQADCFSGNTSVVIHSDGRLDFVACWSHYPECGVIRSGLSKDDSGRVPHQRRKKIAPDNGEPDGVLRSLGYYAKANTDQGSSRHPRASRHATMAGKWVGREVSRDLHHLGLAISCSRSQERVRRP
jgi:transposase